MNDPKSLRVEENGVMLTYWDSGAPSPSTSYVTIIAVHGLGFTGAVFSKVSAVASNSDVRFVAINRRGYAGSTEYSEDEKRIQKSSSDDEKEAFLAARGHEILSFIDIFVRQNNIPMFSTNRQMGGVMLLGWSYGNYPIIAALSQIDSLPQERLGLLQSHLKSIILYEPPQVFFGRELVPDYWLPLFDTTLPEDARFLLFSQWVTSYFHHDDMTERDISAFKLSRFAPTSAHVPTVYKFSPTEFRPFLGESTMVFEELPLASTCISQLESASTKACFSKTIRDLVPNLEIHHLCGTMSLAIAIGACWIIQDMDQHHGGGFIKYKMIEGANHVLFLEEPQRALEIFLECI